MTNISETKIVEKIKTNFMFNFFFKSSRFFVEKYCTARQATDKNMAHAHSMLDN